MNKQQTAVEWLSEQFDSIVELYPSQFERVNRAIEQAKEMEKEQIMSAYNNCELYNPEQYYEQTYKGGNK
jgi:HEPN domain-containing protein